MRICLLARFFDYRGTGITRMATELLQGLVEKGYSIHTVSTKGTSLYSYFWYTSVGIPSRLPRKDIDVYHAVTSPMEGIWLPRDKGITTYCDLIPVTNPERFGSGMGYSRWKNFIGRMYSKIGWKLASQTKILTCTSEEVKQELISYLEVPEYKVRVIRMGIREDLLPSKRRDKIFRIGYLGQLDKRKRVSLLIEAFRASKIDGELVIAGKGLDESRLKEQLNSDPRIKFLGLVPDNNLAAFYNSLDLFVFPTWVEGYGLPIVEAMACKKPVIVLSDSIIPQEVKSRCIIVENLEMVLGDKNHLEGLCRGVDYDSNYAFAKEHSWAKYVNSYIKLYEELVTGATGWE